MNCFLFFSWSAVFILPTELTEGSGSHSSINILIGCKKNFSALSGLENSENINCQNSVLIITNGIRKVRKGVDIFDRRISILVS